MSIVLSCLQVGVGSRQLLQFTALVEARWIEDMPAAMSVSTVVVSDVDSSLGTPVRLLSSSSKEYET